MKKNLLFKLICSFCLLSTSFYHAQVVGYALTGLTQTSTSTVLSCDSTITMSFSAQTAATTAGTVPADIQNVIIGNNFAPFQFSVQINWGDGATTTHNAGTSTSGTLINFNPPITHTYNSSGTYPISITVYNPANQTYVIDTINYTIGCGGNNYMCMGGQVFCDTDNNGVYNTGDIPVINAPVNVVSNGTTYTGYTNNTGFYTISYAGTAGQTAVVSVNQNWMVNNGYIAGTWPITINNVTCNSGLPLATANFPMNCGSNQGNTNCYAGFVFCDANGNGTMDTNESPIVGAPVLLYSQNTIGSNTVTVYSDTNGFFIYCGPVSNTNYVIGVINQQWLTYNGYTMPNNIITLVGINSTTPNAGYFAVNCGGGANLCADLWSTVTPWIGYYQNTTAYFHLNWGSYGPGPVGAYTLTLTYPAGVTVNTSSIANTGYVISGNTITWNLNSGLNSFSSIDLITFNVPSGIQSGTQHYFTSTITPAGNIVDCSTSNNNGSLLQIVGNSYDPNDKVVVRPAIYETLAIPSEQIDASLTDALTYTIQFQNTGTSPAQNIYILDTLDANLDWSTFTLVESSHNMQVVNMGNGLLKFEYPNIWLDDSTSNEPGSHGHLVYRIQENSGNPVGSTIENTAYIYFDWNAPIITNTTYNINTMLVGVDESSMNQFKLYPNPSTDNISITGNITNFAYKIMDMSGRELVSGQVNNGFAKIAIESLTNGHYLVQIASENANETLSFIKQ